MHDRVQIPFVSTRLPHAVVLTLLPMVLESVYGIRDCDEKALVYVPVLVYRFQVRKAIWLLSGNQWRSH